MYLRKLKTALRLVCAGEKAEIVKRIRQHYQAWTQSRRRLRQTDQQLLSQLSVPFDLSMAKDLQLLWSRVSLLNFLFSEQKLTIPQSSHPVVSIVLVFFNKAEHSFSCLKSILELSQEEKEAIELEVLIVDNVSTDDTSKLLSKLTGPRILSPGSNLGFLKACNLAAREARGEYILLLNNDAVLTPGSLKAALKVFSQKNVGAVGGRIILPHGRLQEAGNILFQDGSCVGYGRERNPFDPEFLFQRDVDYVSGVFLLTPRQLFLELGGFDEVFIPAYYEETDYCVRLWKKGFRVVYEPRCVVVHYEFGSSSAAAAAFQLMQVNREKFLKKHFDYLQVKPKPTSEQLFHRSSTQKKRILYIEDRPPHLYFGAGLPRANMILDFLVQWGYDVTLYPLYYPYEPWDEVYSDVPHTVEVMNGFGPRELRAFYTERRNYYDKILISRPHNMKIALEEIGDLLQKDQDKIIYDAEAFFSAREDIQVQVLESNFRNWREKEELNLTRFARAIVSVSPKEAEVFRSKTSKPVYVVGHGNDIHPSQNSFQDRKHFLIVGAIHAHPSPNSDGLFWFLKNVFERLRTELGSEGELWVVGYNAMRDDSVFQNLPAGVRLFGRVPSLEEYFNSCRVNIVPTRFAAGIPQKLFDATAAGIPSVCTPLIATQMGWQDGSEALVADWQNPDDFYQKCIRLYRDEKLWDRLRLTSLDYMKKNSSRAVFERSLSEALHSF